MYMFLYFMLILLSLIGIKYKSSKYFSIIVLIFTSIIVYMHTYCPDYSNYENVYNYILNGNKYYDTGIGWYYICLIFTKIGIDFRVFKTIICAISIIIINTTLKKFLNKKNQRYFWCIYLIFPLLIQLIQFRNFLATALVFYALGLLQDKNIKNKILCFIFILFACLIHSSIYVILEMYIILQMKFIRNNIKMITVFSLLILIYLLNFNQNIIINIISNFINEVRIKRYFTSYNVFNNFATLIIDLLIIILNYSSLSSIINKLSNIEKDKLGKKYNIMEITSKMNLLYFGIIPFLLLDNNFIRILEILIILTYLSLLILNENGYKEVCVFKTKIKTYNYLMFATIINFIVFIPKSSVFISLLS